MVGAAIGSDVVLGCRLEASPRPLTSWIRNDGVILLNNKKYELIEDVESYRIHMQLKINNLEENDYGPYKCVARNMLGDKEGFVRLIGTLLRFIFFLIIFHLISIRYAAKYIQYYLLFFKMKSRCRII